MSVSRPGRLRAADMTYIALFSVLITICAWVSIPIPPVPVTLQTFAVFAALATLGGRRGFYSVAVYLLLGIVGCPVFSGFQGGIGVLLGATGGYIAGFLLAAFVFWQITSRAGNPPAVSAIACVAGLFACYAFGTLWYVVGYSRSSLSAGLAAAFSLCVVPFLLPDLLKLSLALLLAHRLKKHLK